MELQELIFFNITNIMMREDLSVDMLRRFLRDRQEHFSYVLKLILFSISNMLTNRDNNMA